MRWEATTRDTIDFKTIYVDMAKGDLIAGLVLSTIIYWHLPAKDGTSRMPVIHEGKRWVAHQREEYYKLCRISPKQLDRALTILCADLCEKRTFKFHGDTTLHVRIRWENFLAEWRRQLARVQVTANAEQNYQREIRELTKGKFPNKQRANSRATKKPNPRATKNPTENSSETTTSGNDADARFLHVEDLSAEQLIAAELLIENGISTQAARRLAHQDADECRAQVAYLPFRKNIQDEAAFLIKAIEGHYPPPSNYLKDQQKQTNAKLQQAAKQKAAEEEKRQQLLKEEQQRAAQALQDELDTHYKSLSAAERKQIDDQAQRRIGAVAQLTQNPAGALAAARRYIIARELGLQQEDPNDQ